MFTILRQSLFAAALLACACSGRLQACTGIKLMAENNQAVHGRTLEFGIPVHITLAMVPRNQNFKATTPNGPGLSYTSKYAAIGCVAFDNIAILDGMNEKGLSVGTFYFPTFAKYTPTNAENQSQGLSPVDFPNWVLTQFATLEEVQNALATVNISPTVIKQWGDAPPPFHYIVYDKKGQSLVIEPIEGKLAAFQNPLGVLTNSPNFDWHLTNLRNYINLSPYNSSARQLAGIELLPFGQGSGLVGLPGDFTPPSRFVRAALFSTASKPAKTAEEAIFQGFHVLNNFDIPMGVAREKTGDSYASDFTQFTCMRDPNSLRYYFKSYADQAIGMVDFSKFDFSGKGIKTWTVSGHQEVVDVTDRLK